VTRQIEKGSDELIFGRNPVMEVIRSGKNIDKVIIQKNIDGGGKKIYSMAKNAGIPLQVVDKAALDRMCSGAHQGVLAYVSSFIYSTIDTVFKKAEDMGENPFLLILDGIEDPHNLGAILRSAEGAGVHGVIIPKRHAVQVTGTVVKVSAGAAMHVDVVRVNNLVQEIEGLRGRGVWLYGLDMDGKNYREQEYSGPIALVVGSEGRGISRLVKENCDFLISIPMKGKVNSLNASAATAIATYEISQSKS
jgi:23S rRNA (guanosine2251-2'-O)-methyltransferase